MRVCLERVRLVTKLVDDVDHPLRGEDWAYNARCLPYLLRPMVLDRVNYPSLCYLR